VGRTEASKSSPLSSLASQSAAALTSPAKAGSVEIDLIRKSVNSRSRLWSRLASTWDSTASSEALAEGIAGRSVSRFGRWPEINSGTGEVKAFCWCRALVRYWYFPPAGFGRYGSRPCKGGQDAGRGAGDR